MMQILSRGIDAIEKVISHDERSVQVEFSFLFFFFKGFCNMLKEVRLASADHMT